jgi:hypothetical protein
LSICYSKLPLVVFTLILIYTNCIVEGHATLVKRGREEDHDPCNSGKRRRVVAKADILKALSEFKDPSLCRHNSYSDSLNLDDERINGSDIDCFVIFGEQLPFTGRGSELDLLANRIERNISIWSRWRNGKLETADEISKRTYEHPAVATGPGRGKTTLMQ